MTNSESDSDGSQGEWALSDCYYPQLLRVARSAGLDLSENRAKDDLLERLDDAGVERVGYDAFELDGEPLELLPPQTEDDGPTDTTVLYCLTRDSTEDHIDDVQDALEAEGFELHEAGEDGDNYKIVLPADADDEEDAVETALEDMTKEELYDLASEQDVDGRSEMTKGELIDVLSA
jgi:hypothetical protein